MIGWKFSTFKKVEITWLDSCVTNGWHTVEEMAKEYLPRIQTIGYLVQQSDKAVTIAHTLGMDERSLVGKGCGYMTIPRGCITHIRRIRK